MKDTAPALSETTASALLVHSDAHEDLKDMASESSCATSVGSVQRSRTRPMPRSARAGKLFECPYCRTIECVKDTSAWIKHVYKDLQPYMCTFEKCRVADVMYEGRRQWFNHELQQHRRSWTCNGHCDQKFGSMKALMSHIKKHKPGVYSDPHLRTMAEVWASPIDSQATSSCQLCGEGVTGTIQLQGHIGRHLEDLALFALPNDSTESATLSHRLTFIIPSASTANSAYVRHALSGANGARAKSTC